MSEDEILTLLICFILGYLLSRQMGNGFSVGGAKGDFDSAKCNTSADCLNGNSCRKVRDPHPYRPIPNQDTQQYCQRSNYTERCHGFNAESGCTASWYTPALEMGNDSFCRWSDDACHSGGGDATECIASELGLFGGGPKYCVTPNNGKPAPTPAPSPATCDENTNYFNDCLHITDESEKCACIEDKHLSFITYCDSKNKQAEALEAYPQIQGNNKCDGS